MIGYTTIRNLPRRSLGHSLAEDDLISFLRKENEGESGGVFDPAKNLSLSEADLSLLLDEQRSMQGMAQELIDLDDRSGFFGKLKKRHRQELLSLHSNTTSAIVLIEQRMLAQQEQKSGMQPETTPE